MIVSRFLHRIFSSSRDAGVGETASEDPPPPHHSSAAIGSRTPSPPRGSPVAHSPTERDHHNNFVPDGPHRHRHRHRHWQSHPSRRGDAAEQPSRHHRSREDPAASSRHQDLGAGLPSPGSTPRRGVSEAAAQVHRAGHSSQRELSAPPALPGRLAATSAEESLKYFQLVAHLGRGTFADVTLARKRTTGELFALKRIGKQKLEQANLIDQTFTERRLLVSLRHPFLVRLYIAVQSRTHLYFLLQFGQGGDFFAFQSSRRWVRATRRVLGRLHYPYYGPPTAAEWEAMEAAAAVKRQIEEEEEEGQRLASAAGDEADGLSRSSRRHKKKHRDDTAAARVVPLSTISSPLLECAYPGVGVIGNWWWWLWWWFLQRCAKCLDEDHRMLCIPLEEATEEGEEAEQIARGDDEPPPLLPPRPRTCILVDVTSGFCFADLLPLWMRDMRAEATHFSALSPRRPSCSERSRTNTASCDTKTSGVAQLSGAPHASVPRQCPLTRPSTCRSCWWSPRQRHHPAAVPDIAYQGSSNTQRVTAGEISHRSDAGGVPLLSRPYVRADIALAALQHRALRFHEALKDCPHYAYHPLPGTAAAEDDDSEQGQRGDGASGADDEEKELDSSAEDDTDMELDDVETDSGETDESDESDEKKEAPLVTPAEQRQQEEATAAVRYVLAEASIHSFFSPPVCRSLAPTGAMGSPPQTSCSPVPLNANENTAAEAKAKRRARRKERRVWQRRRRHADFVPHGMLDTRIDALRPPTADAAARASPPNAVIDAATNGHLLAKEGPQQRSPTSPPAAASSGSPPGVARSGGAEKEEERSASQSSSPSPSLLFGAVPASATSGPPSPSCHEVPFRRSDPQTLIAENNARINRFVSPPEAAPSAYSFAADNSSRIPLRMVAFYAVELALVLEYIHEEQFIYRDLKPENILMQKDGHLLLTDFGVAKDKEKDTANRRAGGDLAAGGSRANTFTGTKHYMSPEVLLGVCADLGEAAVPSASTSSPRSPMKSTEHLLDWWSYGCVLFEWCNGRRAFDARNEYWMFKSIVEENVKVEKDDFKLTALELHARAAQMGFRFAMQQACVIQSSAEVHAGMFEDGAEESNAAQGASGGRPKEVESERSRQAEASGPCWHRDTQTLLSPSQPSECTTLPHRVEAGPVLAAPPPEATRSSDAGSGELDPPCQATSLALSAVPLRSSSPTLPGADGVALDSAGPGSSQRAPAPAGNCALWNPLDRDVLLSSALVEMLEAMELLKDLVLSLLRRNPRERLFGGSRVMEHPFFSCAYVVSQLYYLPLLDQRRTRFERRAAMTESSERSPSAKDVVRAATSTSAVGGTASRDGTAAEGGGNDAPFWNVEPALVASTAHFVLVMRAALHRPDNWRQLFLEKQVRPGYTPRLRSIDDVRYFPGAITALGENAAKEQQRLMRRMKRALQQQRRERRRLERERRHNDRALIRQMLAYREEHCSMRAATGSRHTTSSTDAEGREGVALPVAGSPPLACFDSATVPPSSEAPGGAGAAPVLPASAAPVPPGVLSEGTGAIGSAEVQTLDSASNPAAVSLAEEQLIRHSASAGADTRPTAGMDGLTPTVQSSHGSAATSSPSARSAPLVPTFPSASPSLLVDPRESSNAWLKGSQQRTAERLLCFDREDGGVALRQHTTPLPGVAGSKGPAPTAAARPSTSPRHRRAATVRLLHDDGEADGRAASTTPPAAASVASPTPSQPPAPADTLAPVAPCPQALVPVLLPQAHGGAPPGVPGGGSGRWYRLHFVPHPIVLPSSDSSPGGEVPPGLGPSPVTPSPPHAPSSFTPLRQLLPAQAWTHEAGLRLDNAPSPRGGEDDDSAGRYATRYQKSSSSVDGSAQLQLSPLAPPAIGSADPSSMRMSPMQFATPEAPGGGPRRDEGLGGSELLHDLQTHPTPPPNAATSGSSATVSRSLQQLPSGSSWGLQHRGMSPDGTLTAPSGSSFLVSDVPSPRAAGAPDPQFVALPPSTAPSPLLFDGGGAAPATAAPFGAEPLLVPLPLSSDGRCQWEAAAHSKLALSYLAASNAVVGQAPPKRFFVKRRRQKVPTEEVVPTGGAAGSMRPPRHHGTARCSPRHAQQLEDDSHGVRLSSTRRPGECDAGAVPAAIDSSTSSPSPHPHPDDAEAAPQRNRSSAHRHHYGGLGAAVFTAYANAAGVQPWRSRTNSLGSTAHRAGCLSSDSRDASRATSRHLRRRRRKGTPDHRWLSRSSSLSSGATSTAGSPARRRGRGGGSVPMAPYHLQPTAGDRPQKRSWLHMPRRRAVPLEIPAATAAADPRSAQGGAAPLEDAITAVARTAGGDLDLAAVSSSSDNWSSDRPTPGTGDRSGSFPSATWTSSLMGVSRLSSTSGSLQSSTPISSSSEDALGQLSSSSSDAICSLDGLQLVSSSTAGPAAVMRAFPSPHRSPSYPPHTGQVAQRLGSPGSWPLSTRGTLPLAPAQTPLQPSSTLLPRAAHQRSMTSPSLLLRAPVVPQPCGTGTPPFQSITFPSGSRSDARQIHRGVPLEYSIAAGRDDGGTTAVLSAFDSGAGDVSAAADSRTAKPSAEEVVQQCGSSAPSASQEDVGAGLRSSASAGSKDFSTPLTPPRQSTGGDTDGGAASSSGYLLRHSTGSAAEAEAEGPRAAMRSPAPLPVYPPLRDSCERQKQQLLQQANRRLGRPPSVPETHFCFPGGRAGGGGRGVVPVIDGASAPRAPPTIMTALSSHMSPVQDSTPALEEEDEVLHSAGRDFSTHHPGYPSSGGSALSSTAMNVGDEWPSSHPAPQGTTCCASLAASPPDVNLPSSVATDGTAAQDGQHPTEAEAVDASAVITAAGERQSGETGPTRPADALEESHEAPRCDRDHHHPMADPSAAPPGNFPSSSAAERATPPSSASPALLLGQTTPSAAPGFVPLAVLLDTEEGLEVWCYVEELAAPQLAADGTSAVSRAASPGLEGMQEGSSQWTPSSAGGPHGARLDGPQMLSLAASPPLPELGRSLQGGSGGYQQLPPPGARGCSSSLNCSPGYDGMQRSTSEGGVVGSLGSSHNNSDFFRPRHSKEASGVDGEPFMGIGSNAPQWRYGGGAGLAGGWPMAPLPLASSSLTSFPSAGPSGGGYPPPTSSPVVCSPRQPYPSGSRGVPLASPPYPRHGCAVRDAEEVYVPPDGDGDGAALPYLAGSEQNANPNSLNASTSIGRPSRHTNSFRPLHSSSPHTPPPSCPASLMAPNAAQGMLLAHTLPGVDYDLVAEGGGSTVPTPRAALGLVAAPHSPTARPTGGRRRPASPHFHSSGEWRRARGRRAHRGAGSVPDVVRPVGRREVCEEFETTSEEVDVEAEGCPLLCRGDTAVGPPETTDVRGSHGSADRLDGPTRPCRFSSLSVRRRGCLAHSPVAGSSASFIPRQHDRPRHRHRHYYTRRRRGVEGAGMHRSQHRGLHAEEGDEDDPPRETHEMDRSITLSFATVDPPGEPEPADEHRAGAGVPQAPPASAEATPKAIAVGDPRTMETETAPSLSAPSIIRARRASGDGVAPALAVWRRGALSTSSLSSSSRSSAAELSPTSAPSRSSEEYEYSLSDTELSSSTSFSTTCYSSSSASFSAGGASTASFRSCHTATPAATRPTHARGADRRRSSSCRGLAEMERERSRRRSSAACPFTSTLRGARLHRDAAATDAPLPTARDVWKKHRRRNVHHLACSGDDGGPARDLMEERGAPHRRHRQVAAEAAWDKDPILRERRRAYQEQEAQERAARGAEGSPVESTAGLTTYHHYHCAPPPEDCHRRPASDDGAGEEGGTEGAVPPSSATDTATAGGTPSSDHPADNARRGSRWTGCPAAGHDALDARRRSGLAQHSGRRREVVGEAPGRHAATVGVHRRADGTDTPSASMSPVLRRASKEAARQLLGRPCDRIQRGDVDAKAWSDIRVLECPDIVERLQQRPQPPSHAVLTLAGGHAGASDTWLVPFSPPACCLVRRSALCSRRHGVHRPDEVEALVAAGGGREQRRTGAEVPKPVLESAFSASCLTAEGSEPPAGHPTPPPEAGTSTNKPVVKSHVQRFLERQQHAAPPRKQELAGAGGGAPGVVGAGLHRQKARPASLFPVSDTVEEANAAPALRGWECGSGGTPRSQGAALYGTTSPYAEDDEDESFYATRGTGTGVSRPFAEAGMEASAHTGASYGYGGYGTGVGPDESSALGGYGSHTPTYEEYPDTSEVAYGDAGETYPTYDAAYYPSPSDPLPQAGAESVFTATDTTSRGMYHYTNLNANTTTHNSPYGDYYHGFSFTDPSLTALKKRKEKRIIIIIIIIDSFDRICLYALTWWTSFRILRRDCPM
eukprot:gene1438-834_t